MEMNNNKNICIYKEKEKKISNERKSNDYIAIAAAGKIVLRQKLSH